MRTEQEIREMIARYKHSQEAYAPYEDEYCDLYTAIGELEWVLEAENS